MPEELKYHKITTPENYPDDDKKPEQSDRSHLLEHHLKIQQLEQTVLSLRREMDAMETLRRKRQRDAVILLFGVCYGLFLAYILLS